MRTPGNDAEMAAGFLLSEAIITKKEDIRSIELHRRNRLGNVIDVFLAPEIKVDHARLTRHVFASSSCGLCGKATIASVHQHFPAVRGQLSISASVLSKLPQLLAKEQATFKRTGGLHAAAIFDAHGALLVVREDVGRHNAVDKVLGWLLMQGHMPCSKHILLVSGRASFEIVQKALAARIPVVAAVSAPSSLAVTLARTSRQTLVAFLREGRMNVYAGAKRVKW
jgi:FdhD protein